MSFGDAVKSVYGNYARFDGRATRSEYWWFQLFLILAVFGVGLLTAFLLASTRTYAVGGIVGPLVFVFLVASVIPSLAVTVRRLHDTDRSGWWMLIAFLPSLGSLILLIFTLLPSSPGYNRFGPPYGQPPSDAQAEYHGWSRSDALRQFSEDAQRAAA